MRSRASTTRTTKSSSSTTTRKDEAVWQPVEEHCRELGARFRFFHVDAARGLQGGRVELRAAAHGARRRRSSP